MADKAPDDRVQTAVRLPRALLAEVDARAGRYNLSRNAWIEMALTRVVSMPSQVTNQQKRF